MTNLSKLPINSVNDNKPKMLTGLNQKVSGQDDVLPDHVTGMLSRRRIGRV